MLLQKRIHEWSKTLPGWQRDLLRRLAAGPLSTDEQNAVLALLTQDEGALTPIPLELDGLPADEDEHGPVELRAVSDLENINLLAGGQSLAVEPGLNVVFGLTGAGKSGYGRLLRRVCRAAHRGEVLRDAFAPGAANAAQTARLSIVVDGEDREVTVDLAEDPERLLSAMAVFDSRCANVYLTGPSTIEHVPPSLLLLKQLSDTQDALARELSSRAQAVGDKLPPLPQIDPKTAVGQALGALSATTHPDELEDLARMTEEERTELKELDIAAATIKSDQSLQLEGAARARARGATNAADALDDAADRLSDSRLDALRETQSRLADAMAAERELADKAFSGQRFTETGQGPWREMWEATRRFVEAGGGTFPATGHDAACPVCQQDLDGAARERLATFEEFVRGNLSERIVTLRAAIARQAESLPDVSTIRNVSRPRSTAPPTSCEQSRSLRSTSSRSASSLPVA